MKIRTKSRSSPPSCLAALRHGPSRGPRSPSSRRTRSTRTLTLSQVAFCDGSVRDPARAGRRTTCTDLDARRRLGPRGHHLREASGRARRAPSTRRGPTMILIGLLLPAVQKVRQAAAPPPAARRPRRTVRRARGARAPGASPRARSSRASRRSRLEVSALRLVDAVVRLEPARLLERRRRSSRRPRGRAISRADGSRTATSPRAPPARSSSPPASSSPCSPARLAPFLVPRARGALADGKLAVLPRLARREPPSSSHRRRLLLGAVPPFLCGLGTPAVRRPRPQRRAPLRDLDGRLPARHVSSPPLVDDPVSRNDRHARLLVGAACVLCRAPLPRRTDRRRLSVLARRGGLARGSAAATADVLEARESPYQYVRGRGAIRRLARPARRTRDSRCSSFVDAGRRRSAGRCTTPSSSLAPCATAALRRSLDLGLAGGTIARAYRGARPGRPRHRRRARPGRRRPRAQMASTSTGRTSTVVLADGRLFLEHTPRAVRRDRRRRASASRTSRFPSRRASSSASWPGDFERRRDGHERRGVLAGGPPS